MKRQIKLYPCLNQGNYGGKLDCSITSITSVVYFYFQRQYPLQKVYDAVESIAEKKYCYNEARGTNPLFIKNILNDSLKHYSNKKYSTKSKYLKNIGYNFNTIKDLIDKDIPVILSVWKCEKYKNHTVTIFGYDEETQELIISDNWVKWATRIKYKNISTISSINYM